METGSGSSGPRSSPAEDGQLWAALLSDPLDVSLSLSTPATEICATYVDYGANTMAIQQILEGPQDGHDLERWFEGAVSALTAGPEVNLTHPSPATTQPERQGTCAASTVDLLDYIPRSEWRRRCRPRGHRKRRTPLSTKQMLLRNHFGDIPSASNVRRHGLRTNNEHWTLEEVTKLVDGIEEYGVGPWTQLKKQKFSTSARTTVHIKDKWRNLLKAYAVNPTSTKKENAKGRFLVPETLIKRIQKLAAEHPYPKSRRTSE